MRKLEKWIEDYLFYTEKQESPEAFHRWCAISVLAASMERSCWIDNGYYNLYPNQYIILVGASASTRKSSAINLAQDLFNDAFPKGWTFSQKITSISLITFLKDSYKERGFSGGYIIADELSVFLGNALQDATLVQLLTKIYTCPKVMDYSTVARGREIAHLAFANLLGGTTPEWIKDSFPVNAIAGGFAGRIVFIYQEKSTRKFARPKLDDERRKMREMLVEDLKEIGQLKGEFKLSKDADAWYIDWYENVYNPDKGDIDLRGYYGRKHDLVLKLSMVNSVCRSNSMRIERDDIADGIDILEDIEVTLPETLKLIQATTAGRLQQKILSHIRKQGGKISRVALLYQVSNQVTARDLDDLMTTLIQSGRVETFAEANGIFYTLK